MSDWDIRFSEFAGNEIRKQALNLQETETIPHALWRSMCAHRLFGLVLPIQYGGLGEDFRKLLEGGRHLVAFGGNTGIALSWLIHEMTSGFLILRFGRSEQHSEYLPDLAAGNITAAFAVSEPDGGAHPKHISTKAEKDGGEYVLTGEKAYITNGPIADLFIIVAVTGETSGGRKQFTTFIVPKSTPGLRTGEPLSLDMLHPSPHCGLSLENCRIPEENILGEAGSAYEKIVLPFAEAEDTFMAGLINGGLHFLIQELKSRSREEPSLDDAIRDILFDAHCALSSLEILADNAAHSLAGVTRPEIRRDVKIYLRGQAEKVLASLVKAASRIEYSERIFDLLAKDLSGLLRIGKATAATRKKQRRENWFFSS